MLQAIKWECCKILERYLPQWVALGHELARIPELGYDETRTAERIATTLRAMGLQPETGWARTGVRAVLETGQPGPRLGLVTDMDALWLPDSPHADRLTGAAHACGHHLQIVVMLAVMATLARSGVLKQLAGSIVFWATPAEEISDPAERLARKIRREMRYLTGKFELAHQHAFDDLRMVLAVHAGSQPQPQVGLNGGACSLKWIARQSRSAPRPADLVLTNALWPVLHDCANHYRLDYEPIAYEHLQQGGALMGCLLAHHDPEILAAANLSINHRLIAMSAQMRAGLTIRDEPLYYPTRDDQELSHLVRRQTHEIYHGFESTETSPKGYTDLGALSARMPVSMLWTTGCRGETHSPEFTVVDYSQAFVAPAQVMIGSIIELLGNNARRAQEIIAAYRPDYTWNMYQAFLSRIQR